MKYYVYELARPDGSVFYVGKGSGNRIKDHRLEAKNGHFCYKCNVIRKIWESGSDFSASIVFQTDVEPESFKEEKRLIAYYGRNNLTNCTDGGEGMSGWIVTAECRKNTSERLSLRWKEDAEYRKRMSEQSRVAMSTQVVREKWSKHQKERYKNPIEKAKLALAQIARWAKPEQHLKLIEQNRKRWSDPQEREKLAARNKSTESRNKLSATRKAQWANPEYRAMMNRSAGRKSYAFKSPSNEIFVVNDLAEFCRQHRLDLSSMCKIANGKAWLHKGWTRHNQ